MSKLGTCKFCGKETKLVKSHIIPKFLYSDNSTDKKTFAIDAAHGAKTIYQAGVWDYILCENCERLMAVYDKFFLDFTNINFDNYIFDEKQHAKIYTIPSSICNHIKMREFFISLLWRASVSTKKEFEMINLGIYENKALDILKGDATYENLFVTLLYKEPNNEFSKGLHFIEKTKYENQILYRICFGGFQSNTIINTSGIRSDKRIFNRISFNEHYIPVLESPELTEHKMDSAIKYYKHFHTKYINK